ncbi:L10-interacting MYB domain-containing protein [Camellia lanceoleosa]|uniref:L10-interacting MYB domain-containing protein n=1 Tax=Camellia lanceoleosa TaxID=1840588 RepID=A0ACC0G5N7_9ERIC|nr:L10-interacting MYB domain-containing protein [Camellia lanceoleosa]
MASTRTSPRTPSKTKGTGVAPTQQQPVHKCTWDQEKTKLFLQLVIAKIGDGNRQLCSMSMSGYKKLAKKFHDKTGLLHSATQMKNKYDNLKKDWIAWKKLQDSSQGFTGIGYDHTSGLFTAPDHWWAKMEAMNHRCAKFKTKPLEHMDLMERVYAGASATGKHAWTPSEICETDVTGDNAATPDSGMAPLSGGTPPHGVPDRVGENVMDCSLFDDAPPHSTADGSANAKRRKRAAPSTVASSMDNLVEAVSKQNRELKITQYVVTGKGENTVGDCLARLMTVPGLQGGGPLFSFACSLMDSPDNRDLIMGLPLDYVVNWLKEKRAITHQPVVVERSRGVRLFGQDGVVDMD